MKAKDTKPGSLAERVKTRIAQHQKDNAPHLIIEARAGTGKTTTLVEGLKRIKGIPSTFTASPQQAVIWDAMEQSQDARSVCFVAFNKAIAEELKGRVPAGCDAMTMHSLGFRAVTRAFGHVQVNSYRVQDIISELLETDVWELRRTKPAILKATEEMVGLCKQNLVGYAIMGAPPMDWVEPLTDLASYYDVDLNGQQQEVFALVPRVLEQCKDAAKDGACDFNDMIWLPVILSLPVNQYDLLLVDEAQDLNRCQQALAKRVGQRLILCGDPKQSIYGFAGADCESMNRLERELKATERGCLRLPLTVTRRCGKTIVREAQRLVPDFSAFETNPEGQILTASMGVDGGTDNYVLGVVDGDMILCRCNAPLVSECFKFLRAGRKANIRGRDVGAGLVSTVKKVLRAKDEAELCSHSSAFLTSRLAEWVDAESAKERAKKNPSESKLIALQDRYDCLVCFAEEAATAADVVSKINAIFTDDKNGQGITLSSVHKAKGLESKRVFILQPSGATMPHPMAKSAWEREQEMNIKYVAITRAIEELVWVS